MQCGLGCLFDHWGGDVCLGGTGGRYDDPTLILSGCLNVRRPCRPAPATWISPSLPPPFFLLRDMGVAVLL